MVKGIFRKIPKDTTAFKGMFFEITKIFGEFVQISSFLHLKSAYLVNRF
jgi:hypothetical protein